MTTQTATKHTPRIVPGKDRYGHFLMIDDFRSAMPSAEVAQLLAAAPELLEVLEALAAFWQNGTPVHAGSEVANEALAEIRKAKGE